jgi:hypothetical protein
MAARAQMFPKAGWWFLALFGVSVLAFWPVYFAVLPYGPEGLVHLHMAGVTAWFALLVSQPFLIARGRFDAHRKLGGLSYLLAPYVAVTALALAHSRFGRMDGEAFARDGHSVYLPLVAIFLFLVSWGLGIRHRRKAHLHARYMIGTAFAFSDPIVARFLYFYTPVPPGPFLYPAIGFGVADLGLLLLWWADRGRKGRAVWHVLLPIFVLAHLGWFTLAQSQTWFDFASWFKGI